MPIQTPVQPSAPKPSPRKYNMSYDGSGNIYYNDKMVGNMLFSDFIDIGENAWLEGWAKTNDVNLVPNGDWLAANPTETTKTPKTFDLSEQSLASTFGVSEEERDSDKVGKTLLSGLNTMLPIKTSTGTRGLNEVQRWQDDKQGYGKGFAPENLNPFFTK